ncbi:MAG: hypothetical protein KBD83_04440 [Gammaproteobacteria bacterium]|nr:hypothetical protein [Gammaproteobacteria bacterium]
MNESRQQQDWGSESTPAHWSLKTGPIINEQNKGVYLAVVWILGLIALLALVGVIGLSYLGTDIPQALIALGSVAVGALGSLFTHSK